MAHGPGIPLAGSTTLSHDLPGTGMSELDVLREWFRYNDAVRPAYLTALAKLPMERLVEDRGASFPLLDIFLHVLDAQRLWIGWVPADRLREWEREMPRLRFRTRIRTFPEAEAAMREVQALVERFLAGLTDADLARRIEYEDEFGDGKWVRTHVVLRDLLWHLVEEELQHRGEMNALLWQLGQEPPILDWIDWKAGRRRG